MHRGSILLLLALTGCPKGGISIDDSDACPKLGVASTLDFAGTPIGEATSQDLDVADDCVGDGALEVTASLSGDAAFVLATTSLTVQPGESAPLTVTFTAPDYAEHTATIELLTNDGGDPATITVTGHASTDQDADGDDAVAAGGDDCDDTNPTVFPGASESRNLADDDCDGTVDEDFVAFGDVLVTEIMPSPAAVSDSLGEYFEVYNASAYAVDLVGWDVTADDGDTFTVDGPLQLAPGEYAVFGVQGDSSANGGVPVDYVYDRGTFALGDADTIFLAVAGKPVFDLDYGGSGWTLQDGDAIGLDPLELTATNAGQGKWWCVQTSTLADGDGGTPGAVNDECSNVDHDGDGVTLDGGDCDDADPTVYPGADESWNGVDDDCNGQIDDIDATDAVGWVSGDTYGYLGSKALGAGDVDGDGVVEVFTGSMYANSYAGGVNILPGNKLATYVGAAASTYQESSVAGTAGYDELGNVATSVADAAGNANVDLVVGGNDMYYGHGYSGVGWALFQGPVAGSYDEGDAAITVTGYAGSVHVAMGDLDGDGVDEVLAGCGMNYGTTSAYSGVFTLWQTSDMASGAYVRDDADLVAKGASANQQVGLFVSAPADLDGDGYVDALATAPGIDNQDGGAYVVLGGPTLPSGNGAMTTYADFVFKGPTTHGAVGNDGAPDVGDFDGDGQTDLALSSSAKASAWVWLDTTSLDWLSGSATTDTASVTITDTAAGSLGSSLAVADFDRDGRDDLALGAVSYSGPGAVYVFSGTSLTAGSHTTSSASVKIAGASTSDYFGNTVLAGDLDGDGKSELVVSAPYGNTYKGAVYFFAP